MSGTLDINQKKPARIPSGVYEKNPTITNPGRRRPALIGVTNNDKRPAYNQGYIY